MPPIGLVTTAICIASMRRERQAATRNLRRILGTNGWRLRRSVWNLFYNFSRFVVSFCDFRSMSGDALEVRVSRDPSGEARIHEALSRGKGLIVLTAHLGNWEVGTRLLQASGARVNVVMRLDRANAVERWLQRFREKGSIRVLRSDGSPGSILALRAALARNEVLAMQGDRATGERIVTVDLFAAPFTLPMGPFLLALGCDATLLPAFVVQEGWWRWRSEIGTPVRFPRSGSREADLAAGASEYAGQLERIVRKHPDQWFNFYEMWPQ